MAISKEADYWRQRASWVIRYNPIYPLSALCILIGCWQLVSAAELDGALEYHYWTFIVLQGYEVAVLAAAIWLARRRCEWNHATLLLGLEALLLGVSFFLHDTFFMRYVGWRIALPNVLGAAVKLALVWRLVAPRWSLWPLLPGFATLVLTGLFPGLVVWEATPQSFSVYWVFPEIMHVGWLLPAFCLAGALAVAFRYQPRPPAPSFPSIWKPQAVWVLNGILFLFSILHLVWTEYSYRLLFEPYYIAPLLFVAGLLWDQFEHRRPSSTAASRLLSAASPVAGVLMAFGSHPMALVTSTGLELPFPMQSLLVAFGLVTLLNARRLGAPARIHTGLLLLALGVGLSFKPHGLPELLPPSSLLCLLLSGYCLAMASWHRKLEWAFGSLAFALLAAARLELPTGGWWILLGFSFLGLGFCVSLLKAGVLGSHMSSLLGERKPEAGAGKEE